MNDLKDRLAEALRSTLRSDEDGWTSARAVLAEYDASHHKPDAAERCYNRMIGQVVTREEWIEIIREELAADLAERDARDRERELVTDLAIQACHAMLQVYSRADQAAAMMEAFHAAKKAMKLYHPTMFYERARHDK